MRIIGGIYRSRLIDFPKNQKTRPTKDMVRQGIFNAISRDISGKNALDLFAGSGAMGIEALSRGALRVSFVDRDSQAVACIKKNLASLNIPDTEILTLDAQKAIAYFENQKRVFDVVFLDPPYSDKETLELLNELDHHGIISSHGIIIYEGNAPLAIDPNRYSRIKNYRYGITVVTILWR